MTRRTSKKHDKKYGVRGKGKRDSFSRDLKRLKTEIHKDQKKLRKRLG